GAGTFVSDRARRPSLVPDVLAEVVPRARLGAKVPAHALARPRAGEHLVRESDEHVPRRGRLSEAVAARHRVVEPAVWHTGKDAHAVALARVLERAADAAHVAERDAGGAFAEEE